MIARCTDGLPLAASVQDDEMQGRSYLEYQNQAKMLFKKLSNASPNQMSIETGPYFFHYLIDNNVCYLTLCDKGFSKKLAFQFLEQIMLEFASQYGSRVQTTTRPYTFIEFDTYIQKSKKSILEARGRRNLNQLNSELQDVQRIMVQNIDDVLQRGVAISDLDNKASSLSMMSAKYKKDARYLNMSQTYAKIAAVGIVSFVVILYFWVL